MPPLGQMPGKTPLINIRAEHYFDIPELADQADVLAVTVYDMLVGNPVPHLEAEKVLAAVSRLSGTQWTLENTDITFCEESNGEPA